MLSLTERQVFLKGEDIFREGQQSLHAFIIESGEVQLWRRIYGDKRTIRMLGPGKIIGECAFIACERRIVNATAIKKTVCIRLQYETIQEILNSSPPTVKILLKMLSKQLTSHQR